jgi:hypothetical protein
MDGSSAYGGIHRISSEKTSLIRLDGVDICEGGACLVDAPQRMGDEVEENLSYMVMRIARIKQNVRRKYGSSQTHRCNPAASTTFSYRQ